MNNYVGKYRVVCERDYDGNVMDRDMTYLSGTRGYPNARITRISEDTLNLYVTASSIVDKGSKTCSSMLRSFKKLGIEVLNVTEYSYEADIVFYEKDLNLVDEIISIKTSGKHFSPWSIKNHPNYKQIKADRWNALSDDEKQIKIEKGKRLNMSREDMEDELINDDE